MGLKTKIPDAVIDWLNLGVHDTLEWHLTWTKEGKRCAEVTREDKDAVAASASESVREKTEVYEPITIQSRKN